VSFQTIVENRTPFSASKFIVPDPDGQEMILLVVAASFVSAGATTLKVAEQQRPVCDADQYYGDPASSSVRFEADLALVKPSVDVVVVGHAYAPRGRSAPSVPVHMSVGDIRKDLLVTGDRFWRVGPLGASPSSPQPFERMPIVFERAFGGIDQRAPDPAQHAFELRNLVGVGLQGAPSRDPAIQTEVPNIERPGAMMRSRSDRPEPAGLGVVSRGWSPRLQYAGTFDARWLDERWPMMPTDFDSRFNQCAPHDQQSRTLQGGEPVRLVNLTEHGDWQFRLPTIRIPVALVYDDHHAPASLRLDTIVIEPDVRRVTLTSRTAIRVKRNRALLREIALGHMSKAWLRAKSKAKRYIDYSGRGGALRDARTYEL